MVCVIWLVRKAVENENAAVEAIVAEANQRRLKDAEERIRERFLLWEAGALGVGAPVSWGARSIEEPFDAERASALLQSARSALEAAGLEETQAVGLRILSEPELLAARASGGRSVAAMVALMVLDGLGEGESLEADLGTLIEERIVGGPLELPAAQRRLLMRRYARFASSSTVRAWQEEDRRREEWLAAMAAAGDFPPDTALSRSASWLCLADLEEKRAVILSFPEAVALMQATPALQSRDMEARIVAEAGDRAFASRPLARRLAAPLDFAYIELLRPAALSEDAEAGRGLLYIWIGAIVLGLSIASASAIVLFLRKQESSTRLKNELVATVSHELKTPVSSIRLLVDTLLDPIKRERVNQEEYIELIARENLRLGRLIDNFLSFSRMERNKSSFELRPTDPRAVILDAVEAFRERFSDRTYRLEEEFDDELPALAGDREALATVLGNLLENAFKYGDGCERRIVLRVKAADEGIRFEVEDFGRGIAPRERRRIFERFYRVDGQQGDSGSVGLGLSIVDFVVSQHRGRIELDSALEKGSNFKITIPYA